MASSASEARQLSRRNASMVGGVARSTSEAGQCAEGRGHAGQLVGESNTIAPEADQTVSTELAGLVARARKEARLTNVVQCVDEELLRLPFRSLRKQAAPGVDGHGYEDYAANLGQNLSLRDVHDTFVFRGFTHYLAKTRSGMLNIERKPSVKASERFIRTVRTWLMRNRHLKATADKRGEMPVSSPIMSANARSVTTGAFGTCQARPRASSRAPTITIARPTSPTNLTL
jgi:hypothetical protein